MTKHQHNDPPQKNPPTITSLPKSADCWRAGYDIAILGSSPVGYHAAVRSDGACGIVRPDGSFWEDDWDPGFFVAWEAIGVDWRAWSGALTRMRNAAKREIMARDTLRRVMVSICVESVLHVGPADLRQEALDLLQQLEEEPMSELDKINANSLRTVLAHLGCELPPIPDKTRRDDEDPGISFAR